MKIAGYILTFYLLLLSAVPCCAFDNCPDDKMEQSANHEEGDGDCGNCSPFFSCEGCAPATISLQPISIEIAPVEIISVYTFFQSSFLPSMEYSIWQPPKLS
jgi:hypothetical protein